MHRKRSNTVRRGTPAPVWCRPRTVGSLAIKHCTVPCPCVPLWADIPILGWRFAVELGAERSDWRGMGSSPLPRSCRVCDDIRQSPTVGVIVREIEQSVDVLRRTTTVMSRALSLWTEAERKGGFGIGERNLETGELWMSEGVYTIFGLRRLSALARETPEEIHVKVLHPDDVESVEAAVAKALEDGEADFTFRVIRPDGEVRHIRSSAQRIEAAEHHPAVLLTTVVDVTPPA
jgi:PAS domain-containing protein